MGSYLDYFRKIQVVYVFYAILSYPPSPFYSSMPKLQIQNNNSLKAKQYSHFRYIKYDYKRDNLLSRTPRR